MWYLSRTPHVSSNSKTNDLSIFPLNNSIFPASDTGIFQNISIVQVPKEIKQNDDKKQHHRPCCSNSWEWFAHLSSPMQFHAVAVPRNPSFRIQVISGFSVLPEQILCAKLPLGIHPRATLCSYSFESNMLTDGPKMQCEDRNLIGASGAIFDGWLYLAGGFKGSPSDVEPSEYLNLAEKLNLKSWEWQGLPPMRIPRAFGAGLALNNKFYVVGGGATLKRSAEIYDPRKNSWQFSESFVPKEADGFAVASLNSRLLMLTWSDRLGVKLWMWNKLINLNAGGWGLISILPNQQVERVRVSQYGARMVRVGNELWVLVGENDDICQVDGGSVWPVFPAPMFRPEDGHEIVLKDHSYAFHFTAGGRISWRQIPIYSN